MKAWGFQRIFITQNPTKILTVCQYWLGTADRKNVFRLILSNPLQKVAAEL